MTDAAIYYDPYDWVVDEHAHEIWKRMRDEVPLYWNEKYEFYALSRYHDVLGAVLDTETYSSAHATVLEMMSPVRDATRLMIWMDPPEHTWHRKLVARAFTNKAMAALEDRLVSLCETLLDPLVDSGGFDVHDDFAGIVPPTMILALLGFPPEFVAEWRHGIDQLFNQMGERGADRALGHDDDAVAPAATFGGVLFEALPALLEERRRRPTDDLISTLANTEQEMADGTSRKLDDGEIQMFVQLLAIAGTETVARNMGWAVVLLDRYPDQRRRLVEDPRLIANGLEEILRFEAPSPVNGRWVTRDVELHDRVVPKDSKVLLLNASGNRDERHFHEPDRFDVTRKIDRHLSFGYGTHFCIGAALARIEGRVMLRELLKRFPSYEVDHDRLVMAHTSTVRGYERVPIRI